MKSPASLRSARAFLVLALGCTSAISASAQGRDPAGVPLAGVGGGIAGMGGFAGSGGMVPGVNIALALSGPVPANGSVLLVISELTAELSITAVPVNGATTVPVTGALTQVEGAYWAWKAFTPLVAGTMYSLEARQSEGATSFVAFADTFEATDELVLRSPALTSEPAVSWVSQLFGQVCCQLWTEFGIEVGACAPTGQRASVQLGPGLSSSDPQALLGQFLYRIWPEGEAASGYAFNPWGAPMVLELSEQADEYCYEIETLSINDLGRAQHDALEPRCAAHGELDEVGETMLELPEGFFDRSACHEPPAMLAEQWCEVNEVCGDDATQEGCSLYGYLCDDEPLPAWSPDGVVVAGASADAGEVDGGADEGGEGGVASLAGSGGMGGGSSGHCSVARPASSQPSGFFALVFAAALAAVRVRRRPA